MSLSGKVFALIFMMIAVASFIGILSVISLNNAPADATVSSSQDAYYNQSMLVNQTMNKTLQVGLVQAKFISPVPILIGICTLGSVLFLFIYTGRK